MSIITSYVLRELYNAAKAPNAQESETMAFWNHYFNKHMFTGDEWVVNSEYPPSSYTKDRKRRCDGVIKRYSTVFMKLILVSNVEGKRHGGSMTEVEAQLVEACESSSKDPTSPHPFGIAIIGTYMKIFQWVNGVWRDVTPSYIDADSSSAHLITTILQRIKQDAQDQPQNASRQTPQQIPLTPAATSGTKYLSVPTYGQSLSTPAYAPAQITSSTGLYNSSAYTSAGAVTTPQQSSLKVIGPYERGLIIEYEGERVKMSRDYIYIQGLGYYQVDKQNPALVPLRGPPENVGISFPYEDGRPYRKLEGGKWVTMDK